MLTHGVAADADAALGDDDVPEELRCLVPVLQTFEVGNALVADDFWNLRVGVLARQVVLALQQGFQHLLVAELVGQFQVFLVFCDAVDVGKRLVQSALFADEHLLNLLVGESRHELHHPVGQLDEHRLGLAATGNEVGIAQSGVDFMDVVQRHPAVVQSEGVGADVALRQFLPYFAAIGHTAQIAVAGSILAALQLAHHVVEPLLYLGITRGGSHIAECRQVVTADVAVESGVLPVGVILSLRLQAGLLQVGGEQTVGIEP